MRLEVKQTEAFREWLAALDDKVGKLAIVSRLDRLSFGLFGDVEPIGEGLSELRIHVGPGYRVYVMQRGKVLVIVLAAGTKRTQRRDIKAARALAGEIREKNGWSS
ncbi:MAG: type II toxin-antitoxin system RelE/ParE family toxin [Alphaproteobacteria bacterium]|jgi:putative addiction module killer protein|nr:type II toxin-antitoxin system RelE/ParE family toxin [Alphaproteobacteria bacterium]